MIVSEDKEFLKVNHVPPHLPFRVMNELRGVSFAIAKVLSRANGMLKVSNVSLN